MYTANRSEPQKEILVSMPFRPCVRIVTTTRKRVPRLASAAAVALGVISLLTGAQSQTPDVLPGFQPIDNAFRAFMQTHNLPGAALAIA